MKEQEIKIPDPPPLRRIYEDVTPTLPAAVLLAVLITAILGSLAYLLSTITPVVNGGC